MGTAGHTPTLAAIHDLGYSPYRGPRGGRGAAVRALYAHGLRRTLGIGRGRTPKVIVFTLLALIYSLPTIQLGLAALPAAATTPLNLADYHVQTQVVVALLVASASADLVGSDRRDGVLPLYFARPLARDDYVHARIAALATLVLIATVPANALLFTANAVAAPDGAEWLRANAGDLPRSLAASALAAGALGSMGVLIGSYAKRRSIALAAFIVVLTVPVVGVGLIVAETTSAEARWALFASPLHVMDGAARYVFDALPETTPAGRAGTPGEQVAWAALPGHVWPLALLTYAAIAAALGIRCYREVE